MHEKNILGIDIGSISIGLIELNSQHEIVRSAYGFHTGRIRETLLELLADFEPSTIGAITATSSVPGLIKTNHRFDTRIAYITAAKRRHQQMGSLLIVGGENFGVALFDEQGEYLNYLSNSSCAAGTGGFLDQQARRLNLGSIDEFSRIACSNDGDLPKIASRCAVFAKTDLIHTQQAGYSMAEICDGLSYGLAKNVVDTLLQQSRPNFPLIFAGGVSKNRSVTRYIGKLLDTEVTVEEYSHLYGALGAAYCLSERAYEPLEITSFTQIVDDTKEKKSYYYEPLDLTLSEYPSFASAKRYEFAATCHAGAAAVEVDVYTIPVNATTLNVYLGFDIGSTSTKAVLMDESKEVLAGFYTRTAGRPVEAVQTVFEAILDFCRDNTVVLNFLAVGTTGSGRKFIGKVIGADLALDEITAHARAAYELDPEVDTIIEIGGQDAKFTTMRNGMVTFSIMNNVCAAGTGSFIEEQAKKLDCPLDQYAVRAEHARAPLSSDRCTVFMERDLNHYLNKGYTVNEILAAVLHSVRENYLLKVAIEDNIGKKIFFQGATAKNKALVAAFEQRLNKPIMVSRFCHLTGALGVALELHDHSVQKTTFRGLELYAQQIPLRSETCELCINHCKLKIAEVSGQTVAFGFLCGRDYDVKKRVELEGVKFDFLKERRKMLKFTPHGSPKTKVKIGLPAMLHIYEEMYLWKMFFNELGVEVVTSEGCEDAVVIGKQLASAEFCAPVTALYGHVKYLADRTDYVFLPNYLEVKQKDKSSRRQFCYFTQFASAMVNSTDEITKKAKIIAPVVRSRIQGALLTKLTLFKALRELPLDLSLLQVSIAYDKAAHSFEAAQNSLKGIYNKVVGTSNDDVRVILLGRPYTVLNPTMNKGVPDLFRKQGVLTFFQDMFPVDEEGTEEGKELLSAFHWNFAAKIMETAQTIAHTEGVYPVLISSFKCTPDAYVIEYFKKLLDRHKKPYLILQLDEHDSNMGYETRIEAGIRAFRNHFTSQKYSNYQHEAPISQKNLSGADSLTGKTLLIPAWDPMFCRVLEAVLRKAGIDARLLEESADSIQRSLRLNTGQCLPLSAVAQNVIDYVQKYKLDTSKVVVWTLDSKISCGLGIFSTYLKELLKTYGGGMEKIDIFVGELSFVDISLKTSFNVYFAMMFAGLIKRMGCKLRPYECVPGTTDIATEKSLEMLYYMFLNHHMPVDSIVEYVVGLFEKIQIIPAQKPKVAIFGDLYARDNETMNQNLIKTIEQNGGEVITTPYSEYMKIIGDPYIKRWFIEGDFKDAATAKMMATLLPALEKRYYRMFERILTEPEPTVDVPYDEILAKMQVTTLHAGESLDNILKVFSIAKKYPDLAFFVQTNPAFCCPSLVTEAMGKKIEQLTGVPVVTIEYDGIGGAKNEDIIPYLTFLRKKSKVVKEPSEQVGHVIASTVIDHALPDEVRI